MDETEDTLGELFARDPTSLTEQHLDTIIDALRTRRHLFKAGNKTAGNVKKPVVPAASLEELDL